MLTITIPGDEAYDEENQEFITVGDVTVELEHSLVSLSKWESFWEKPFLGPKEKTAEETLSYINCMNLGAEIPPELFSRFSNDTLNQINEYINAKMTATWFNEVGPKKKSPETITSELVYYWMISLNIPFECQNWHLNRLFTLIKVCNQKNSPPKKMGRREMLQQREQLNAQRKAQLKTSG